MKVKDPTILLDGKFFLEVGGIKVSPVYEIVISCGKTSTIITPPSIQEYDQDMFYMYDEDIIDLIDDARESGIDDGTIMSWKKKTFGSLIAQVDGKMKASSRNSDEIVENRMDLNVGGVEFKDVNPSLLGGLDLPNAELIYYLDKFVNSNDKC